MEKSVHLVGSFYIKKLRFLLLSLHTNLTSTHNLHTNLTSTHNLHTNLTSTHNLHSNLTSKQQLYCVYSIKTDVAQIELKCTNYR
jgi:hypothetical protein